MTWAKLLFACLTCEALLLAFQTPPDDTLREKGKDLFARRCSGCHALDGNKEGPALRHVYGRRAAAVPGFGYSDSLKQQHFLWDATTLDRWLADPNAVAPATDMEFRVSAPDERTALIAFLKSLSPS